MSVNQTAAVPPEKVQAEIRRLRHLGVFGRQGRLQDLFDYLAGRMDSPGPTREIDIALDVFRKTPGEVAADDPSVRVYVHRLRKRLDDAYVRHGAPEGVRLDIPKGEYRLVARIEPSQQPSGHASSSAISTRPGTSRNRTAALVGASFLLLLLANVGGWMMFGRGSGGSSQLVRTAIWSGMASPERPLLVVVGDYYIFGEFEDRLFLRRLIRDFSINSKSDLLNRYLNDAEASKKYGDLALQYLPTSVAHAMAELAPLLSHAKSRNLILASELTPDRLKSADVLYVGLLSGLGSLRDPVFAASRFTIGESYDDIIDVAAGKAYRSEAFLAAPSDAMYRDYGFFSTFSGPTGNRISVLAGARDTGLLGVVEVLTDAQSLQRLKKAANGAEDFEAVLEVRGQKHVSLESRIAVASPIDSVGIWRGERQSSPTFPTE